MANEEIVKRWMVFGIILAIVILAIMVLTPILISILFGLLFAYIFQPVFKAINKKIGWKTLSALILMIGLLFLIIVPVAYLIPSLVRQTFDTYTLLQNFEFGDFLNQYLSKDMARSVAVQLDNIFGKFFSTFLDQFTEFLVNLPGFLLQLAVFLFTFFFAVKDADKLVKYISSLSPFSQATEKKFLKEFRGITNAIIFGQVLIGIVQGLAVGAGLFFLGVPKALALTFLASVVSMIPVLGSWIVWLPVSLFLLATGQTFAGIFLLLYGGIFVSTIDNLLRPYLLSKQSNLPIALSLIGTIGGLYVFGIAGLVLGPLILAYTLIIIEFYRQGKLNELF